MPTLRSVLPLSGKARLCSTPFLQKLYLLLLVLYTLPLTIEATEWLDQAENLPQEPCPYILYWGGLEARFTYDQSTEVYTSELKLLPEAVSEAIKREPRLWDGKTLLETLALEVNGIKVNSDYNHPEIYQASLPVLKDFAKELKEGDRIAIETINFPDGKYGHVTLLVGPSKSGSKEKGTTFVKRIGISNINWGNQSFAQGEKRLMTTAEFWDMLLSEPKIQYSDQSFRKTDQWNVAIFNEDGPVLLPLADRSDALDLNQLRDRLDHEHAIIQPGASVRFSAWGTLEIQSDTFKTIPIGAGDGTLVITNSGRIPITRLPAEELLTCLIMDDLDPRRFLKPEAQQNYQFKWGTFIEPATWKAFAKTFRSQALEDLRYSDYAQILHVQRLSKKDILNLLRERPQLFRAQEPLNDFRFTFHYQNQDYLIEPDKSPANLIKKLEQDLRPGEIIQIKGIVAHGNARRDIVGTLQHFQQLPELAAKIPEAEAIEVLVNGEKQHLLRISLPFPIFESLRPVLEKVPGIWLQQGDIDLTPFKIEIEVRDEDHKPPLPVNKKD